MERRLAAVLVGDVVGYSRMIRADEEGTLLALRALQQELVDPKIEEHRGRIVKLMGDGILVEFASAVDAVAYGADVQQKMAERNATSPEAKRIVFRIGINLGDVVIDGDDIQGDGVNVAARLEALSEPGGICMSNAVYEQVRDRLDLKFEDLGDQEIKNIDRPVRAWKWYASSSETLLKTGSGKKAAAPPEKPSIAVLAFDNMSGDLEQEYFSDGIAEDIITALSHFREFFVIARNTSFTYKGKAVRVDEVCSDLGVRYVLEGSVRKAGSRVRVTAQLIDGETGTHLWAKRFDRELDDIFAVQDEITQAIVSAVAPETLDAELKRSQYKKPENLNAWEKVIRARWHLGKLTKQDNDTARKLLLEAKREATALSEAYSALALCHLNDMLHLWRTDTDTAITAASEAAREAVTLDGNNASAHAMLGMTALFDRDFDEAMRFLKHAINLNPNLASAHGILAVVHGVGGEYDAAKAAAKLAGALSPLDPSRAIWFSGVGIAAYVAERYEDCVAISRDTLREHPGWASSMRQLTAALAMLGRKEEATAELAKLLERMPGLTVSQVRHMVPVRRPEDWERWLEGLRRAGLPE